MAMRFILPWFLMIITPCEEFVLHGRIECGLPNMVPLGKRVNITIDDVSMPFGLLQYEWMSAKIGSSLMYYLISEVLGYNAEVSGQIDSGIIGVKMLTGCWNSDGSQVSAGCKTRPSRHHLAWETWGGANLGAIEPFQDEMKPNEPLNLGSIGFDAIDGLYMFEQQIDTIYASTGQPIAYYRSWNFTWHDYSNFFVSWQDVDPKRMMPCKDTRMYPTDSFKNDMKVYAEKVGDWAGVEEVEVDGEVRWKAKCEGGDNGFFWLAPACRAEAAKCIPTITGGTGWFIDAVMQKAAKFDMPLALGVAASWSDYTTLPRDYEMVQYWWQPDGLFVDLNPVRVEFPRNDKAAWIQGEKFTSSKDIVLMKFVHNQMYKFAPRVLDMLTSVSLPMPQFDAIFFDQVTNALTEQRAACNWLKKNPSIWARWIPDAAGCRQGDGVIDSSGHWVVNKTDAISCTTCPRGKYSTTTEDKLSHQCLDCDPGKVSEKGMAECTKCSPGRFNTKAGSFECSKCSLGKFATSVGTTECLKCEMGYITTAAGQTQCEACPMGTFKATSETLNCGSCRKGHASGVSGSTACSKCKAGTTAAKEGMSACMNCALGMYTNLTEQTACKRCDVGRYADHIGQSFCAKCVGDFTSEKAAMDPSECFCSHDTYHPEDVSEGACAPCPQGFKCSGGRLEVMGEFGAIMVHNMPILEAGFYATVDEPYKAYACQDARLLCLGGPKEAYPTQCGGGRQGLQCAACDIGHSSGRGGDCVDCTGGLFVWYPLALLCAVIGMAVVHYSSSSDQEGILTQLPMFSVVSLIVSHAQYLALLLAYDINWPSALEDLLNFLQIIFVDRKATSVSCYFGYSLAALYLPGLAIPIGTVALIWVMMVVTRVVSRASGGSFQPMRTDYVINTLGLILTGLSVAVFKLILTIFECRPNPSAESTMANFDGFKCNGDEITPVMPFAVTSILIFIIGGLVGYIYILIRSPSKYYVDISFRRRFQFVLKRWHPTYYWWGALVLIRNLLMCLVSIVSTEGLTQVLFMTLIFAPVYVGTVSLRPWKQKVANWTDVILSSTFLLLMFFVGMLAEPASDSTRSFLGWIMVLALAAALASVLLLILDLCVAIIRGRGGCVKVVEVTEAKIEAILNVLVKFYFLDESGHKEAVRDISAFIEQLHQEDAERTFWLIANLERGLFGQSSLVQKQPTISAIPVVAEADSNDSRVERINSEFSLRSSAETRSPKCKVRAKSEDGVIVEVDFTETCTGHSKILESVAEISKRGSRESFQDADDELAATMSKPPSELDPKVLVEL